MLNQKQDKHNIRLAGLESLPSLKEIQALQNHANINAGHTVELPFAGPSENYILTACKDRAGDNWSWMLCRGQDNASVPEWSHQTHDARVIHNVITNSFPSPGPRPGSGPKPGLGASLKHAVSPVASPVTAPEEKFTTVTIARDEAQELKSLQKPTLEGELINMQVPNLLQSVALGKMTGRLEVATKQDIANVYFANGAPLHCVMRGLQGEAALIELVGWEEGAFRFYQEPVTQVESIRKRLDWLLMEAATHLDRRKFLDSQGLTMESYLIRKQNAFDRASFRANGPERTAGRY